jgi:hypothetical protein
MRSPWTTSASARLTPRALEKPIDEFERDCVREQSTTLAQWQRR